MSKMKSYRISDEDQVLIATVMLENGLTTEIGAIRFALHYCLKEEKMTNEDSPPIGLTTFDKDVKEKARANAGIVAPMVNNMSNFLKSVKVEGDEEEPVGHIKPPFESPIGNPNDGIDEEPVY